jgi:hypothetical protein
MNNRSIRILIRFLSAVLTGVTLTLFFRGLNSPTRIHRTAAPPVKSSPANATDSGFFNSFGPANSFVAGTGWAAGTSAHGESFVAPRAGTLSMIRIAIEPTYLYTGRETTSADATVFLAQDEKGFPGAVLEQFKVAAVALDVPAECPVLLRSTTCPPLRAGVKYWVCAKSKGGWVWHNSPRSLAPASACEDRPGKWVPGGNGGTAAFSVTVTEQLEEPSL